MIVKKQLVGMATILALVALVYLFAPFFLIKSPANQTLANGAEISWSDCWFTTRWWRPAYCGWFTTAKSKGHSYQLPVVYIPYVGWDRASDPILYLNGGPGSSAYIDEEGMEYWWHWIDQMSAKRDWFIYEQRGTGISPAALVCPELFPLYRQTLVEPIYPTNLLLSIQQQLLQCFSQASDNGYSLDFFNTHQNANDALDLMQILVLDKPVPEWNLYGISYGSRLALEIMRLQPEALRSVVLDGVYPPQVNAHLIWPQVIQDTFERLEAWCMNDITCRNENEFFAQRLELLLPRLRSNPQWVELNIQNGEVLQFTINDINLFNMIVSGMYIWDLAIQVPQLIDDLYAGTITERVEIFARQHVDWVLDESFSDMVYFLIDCHDGGSYSLEDLRNEIQQVPLLADLYTEDWIKYDMCSKVPGLAALDGFRRPVYSDIPTLLLSGELDPVTPPKWGRMAAASLSTSQHRVFKDIGHGVAYSSECGQELIRTFWSAPLGALIDFSSCDEINDYQ